MITEWIKKIVAGPTGFESCEEHEFMIHHISRNHSVADWVIRCLANPDCKGSAKVLEGIMEQRKKSSQ